MIPEDKEPKKICNIFIIVTLFCIIIFACISGILSSFILNTSDSLETGEMKMEVIRFSDSLNITALRILSISGDYATWDDMALYVKGSLPVFEEKNLYPDSYRRMGIDFVGIFDHTGNPLYLHDFKAEQEGNYTFSKEFRDYLLLSGLWMKGLSEAEQESAWYIFKNGTRTGIVVISPVRYHTSDDDTGAFQVMGTYFSDSFLEQLSALLKSNITVSDKLPPDISPNPLSGTDSVPIITRDEKNITAILSITDPVSHEAVIFRLTYPRLFYHQTITTLISYILVIAVIFGVFIAITLIGLSHYLRDVDAVKKEVIQKECSYQDLIDHPDTAYFRLDLSGTIEQINLAGVRMLGYSDISEVIGRNLGEMYNNPDDRKIIRKILFQEKELKNHLVAMKRRDNSIIFVSTNTHLLFSDDGEIEGIEGIAYDQTEKILSVKALQESEDKYRLIYEIANVGIIQSTPEGKLLGINPAFARMIGYDSPEEMLREIENIGTKIYQNPKDREEFLKRIEREGTVQNSEMILVRRDKTPIWVDLSTVALRDLDNHIRSYFSSVIDISGIKAADLAIRRSEERYRIVADNTYDLEFWRDPDDKFLYISPSCLRITGYPQEEFMNNPDLLSRIIYPDDRELWEEHSRQEHDDPTKNRVEFRIIHARGDVRWLSHICQPVYGDDGSFLGIRGSNQDITEKKMIQLALLESEAKFRSIFSLSPVAILVYDFRGQLLDLNSAVLKVFEIPDREQIRKIRLSDHPWINDEEYQGLLNGNSIEKEVDLDFEILSETFLIGSLRKGMALFEISITPIPHPDSKENGWYLVQIHDSTKRALAVRALMSSEMRLKEAEKIAHLGHWELNLRNDTLLWSDELYRIFEINHEEFGSTYESFISRVHPEDRDLVNSAFSRHITEKIPYDITHRVLFPDGRVKYVREKCLTEWDEDQNPVVSLGIIQDLTSIILSKKALTESEEKYRSVVSTLSEGIIVQGADGKILTWNEAAGEILGVDFSALEQDGSFWFWKRFLGIEGPMFDDTTIPPVLSIRLGSPYKFSRIRYTREDGQDVWISLNVTPMVSKESDNPDVAVCSFTDITHDVRVSEAQETLLNIYKQFESLSSEKILRLGLEGCRTVTNSKNWYLSIIEPHLSLSLQRTGLIDNVFFCDENFHFPYSPLQEGIWVKCITEKKPAQYTSPIPEDDDRDGTIKGVYRELAVPIIEHEEVVAVVGVLGKPSPYNQDDIDAISVIAGNVWAIIRHRRAEEEVFESEQKYRQMFNNVSHCLALYEITPEGLPGRITDINPIVEEMIGKTAKEIIQDEDSLDVYLDLSEDQWLRAGDLDSGELLRYETTCSSPLRDPVPVDVTITSFLLQDQVVGLAIIEDISLKKNFEEERIRLACQIERNMADLSILNDGIRNPLMVIMLQSDLLDDETRKKIEFQIRAIDDIVNQLDKRWAESEKILKFLQKHYHIHRSD